MTTRAKSAGPDPRRVEEAGLNALQSQRQLFYDGWLLRLAPGKARRARSVNAHFGSTLPLAQKIRYCERVFEERHLPVLFRMTPFVQPADLDAALAAHGYVAFDPTLVQVARLARPPEPVDPAGCEIAAPSDPEFADALSALQGLSAEGRAALLQRMAASPLRTRALLAYAWPRNVRELRRCLERAVSLATNRIEPAHLPDWATEDADDAPLDANDAARRDELIRLLVEHDGNISAVARAMGKVRPQVQRWLARYRLDASAYKKT